MQQSSYIYLISYTLSISGYTSIRGMFESYIIELRLGVAYFGGGGEKELTFGSLL